MASVIPTLQSYLARITSEYANKPKFVAYVSALLQPLLDSQALLRSLTTAFDLDTAIGVQLDAVGQWVGRTRFVNQPIANLYFSFDTVGLGWDQGVWKGPFDPSDGLVRLDDDTYRALLKAKVILNSWDGSIAEAAEALGLLLNNPSSIVTIQDNQDMTMTVGISGVVPSPLITALLQGGYLPINPEGVGVNYQITSINSVAIFGFDVSNATIDGWDRGAWAGSLGAGPGMVQGLSVVSVTSTTVTLSWIAPQTGIGPYTYQVQYVLGDGTTGIWQTFGAPTSNTVATVSGLTNGTQYAFEVYAVNPSGPGPVSDPVVVTTGGTVSGGNSAFIRQTIPISAIGSASVVSLPVAASTSDIMDLAAFGFGGAGNPAFAQSVAIQLSAHGTASTTFRNSASSASTALRLTAAASAAIVTTPQVNINQITGATHTTATPVAGSLAGFGTTPTLQYALDPSLPAVSGVTTGATSSTVSLSWNPDAPITLNTLPSGAVVTSTGFSFSLPAMSAGSHTLYVVANGTVIGTTTFTVA
jgi:hypothetical protein